MIGALILGLVAGFIARAVVPGDIFSDMKGPSSWAVSIILGLIGAWVGYMIFNRAFGIGDDDAFDLGGLVGAVVGAILVLVVLGFVVGRINRRAAPG